MLGEKECSPQIYILGNSIFSLAHSPARKGIPGHLHGVFSKWSLLWGTKAGRGWPSPAWPSRSSHQQIPQNKGKGPQRSLPTCRAVPNVPANKSGNGMGGKELILFHFSMGRDTFPVQAAPSPVQHVLEHSQGWGKQGTP